MKFTNKILLENIFSLSVVQLLNYLFPLITFPYLVRVLGVEKFGLLNFAFAFVGYFILITDYGFNISAVRLISINRNDKNKISEIVSSVYVIKSFLFITSAILFFLMINYIPKFHQEYSLFYLTFLMVLGYVFQPQFYFQGIEQSKYIALITFIFRFIWTLLIFTLIKSQTDFQMVAFLTSMQFLLSGITLFFIMLFHYKIPLLIPNKAQLISQLKDGGIIFISSCAISLYTISNTFILGLLTSNLIVGYFTAADKIRQAIQNLFYPFTQSMYPHVSKLFKESIDVAKKFIIKSFWVIGGFSFVISLITFIYAEQIILILVGKNFLHSIYVLKIISFLPFIIYLSNLFGIQTMLNLSYNKQFTYIISLAALINIVITFALVPFLREIGSAVSVLITEAFVTMSIIIILIKKGFFKENEI